VLETLDAGNANGSPATHSFTVDTAAPQTSIGSGPEGPTNSNAPSFGFTTSEPAAARASSASVAVHVRS
jgi:hypothetical protein